VDHYRYEAEGGKIAVDWGKMPDFYVDGTKYSDKTIMACPFSPEEIELDLESVKAMRLQQVYWWIAAKLLKRDFIDSRERPQPEHLQALLSIVEHWYERKLKTKGDAHKNMVVLERYEEVCEAIMKGLSLGDSGSERFRPVWRSWSAVGSTADVLGLTQKATQETRKSHVNLVVADSGWEKVAAKFLEERDYVLSYVKNNFLHFSIPYVDRTTPREYYPDFIARCRLSDGRLVNLVIEISGFAHDKDAKKWYVHNRWLPAVNSVRAEFGWDEWRFCEVTDISAIKETVEAALAE
jgi:type III restriction enzyme